MRGQLQALKQEIDKQEIVNDEMFRNSFKKNTSLARNYGKIALFLCIPLVIAIYLLARYAVGLSWPLFSVIVILTIADAALDYYLGTYDTSHVMESDMMTIAKRLAWHNKIRKKAFIIGVLAFIPVCIWLCVEVYNSQTGFYWNTFESPEEVHFVKLGLIVCIVIGCIIGLITGLVIYRKMQRANRNIIRDIEEMQEGA